MDVHAPELDWLVSVDDHVIEPPNVWVDRLPARVPRRRARACSPTTRGSTRTSACRPRGCRSPPGSARRSSRRTRCRTRRCARPRTTRSRAWSTWTAPGSWGRCASRRSRASAARSSGRRKDKDLALLCVQAYNDWMIDEWCGAAPGRFIPLIIIPLWDPVAAAVEIERCAAQGCDRVRVLGEPRAARPAHHPRSRPLLGPGDGRRAGHADGRVHARRVVVDHAGDLDRTRPAWPTSPSARSAPPGRCSPGCSATTSSGCPGSRSRSRRGTSAGCRTSSSAPSR